MINSNIMKAVLKAQKNELTEHLVYKKLAGIVKLKERADILKKISEAEMAHYEYFRTLTGRDVNADGSKVFLYVFISRVFGLNFGLKMMENGEGLAQDAYKILLQTEPKIESVMRDEKKHELELIEMIDEERLKYMSSVVLGLNDALVELTASLAGFTLALQNSRLIGVVGAITGIAASMSMAASEYLSTKQEETEKNPLKASIVTGIAYVLTVTLLVAPYFFIKNIYLCLGLAIGNALLIILVFTFYMSVSKSLPFRKRFVEMAGLSLSIAAITFIIGSGIRKAFGIDA